MSDLQQELEDTLERIGLKALKCADDLNAEKAISRELADACRAALENIGTPPGEDPNDETSVGAAQLRAATIRYSKEHGA